jgi:hypothetical protein
MIDNIIFPFRVEEWDPVFSAPDTVEPVFDVRHGIRDSLGAEAPFFFNWYYTGLKAGVRGSGG